MKKLFAYPLSVVYYLFFGLVLVVFQPIQWFCFRFLGYQAHKKSVDYLNACLLGCLTILGTRFRFDNPYQIPANKPYIIVSNHQGQYDIPPLIWYLRRLHPKFISKKSLGKGIPSISFNLRHGGSALIDRKDKIQALETIKNLTSYLKKYKRSVVIFPEGTRSKDGIPKHFAKGGLTTLFENMSEAQILPVTINNSWKLMRWGAFPLDIGVTVAIKVHPTIPIQKPIEECIAQVEGIVLQNFDKINPRKSS